MTHEEIIKKIDQVDEELGFLEEVSNKTSEVEEMIKNLRELRHEYERKLHYDKITTAPANQEGC
jgi:hypothetical protein